MKTKQKHNPWQTEVNSHNRSTITLKVLPGTGSNFHCTGYAVTTELTPLSSGLAGCRVLYPLLPWADASVCSAWTGLADKWHWSFRVRPQALPEPQMHTCNPHTLGIRQKTPHCSHLVILWMAFVSQETPGDPLFKQLSAQKSKLYLKPREIKHNTK